MIVVVPNWDAEHEGIGSPRICLAAFSTGWDVSTIWSVAAVVVVMAFDELSSTLVEAD
jgi:hypothetical protein